MALFLVTCTGKCQLPVQDSQLLVTLPKNVDEHYGVRCTNDSTWMHMQPEKSPLTKSLLSFTKSCQSNHALEAAFLAVQMLVDLVSLIAIAAEATVPSCAMM